jgi:hypothetical protein
MSLTMTESGAARNRNSPMKKARIVALAFHFHHHREIA